MTYTNNSASYELISMLADRTGTDRKDWFLTFRAREAMQVVFEEIKHIKGDSSVVLQPFTCSTVPESVIAGGLKLRYSDISEGNLSIDPALLRSCDDARAVIMQHTFGIIDQQQAMALRSIADSGNMVLIEDAAHCAGRMVRDDNDLPLADISVHSFGVEKMVSSSFGAAVWINPDMKDTELHDAIIHHLNSLPATDSRVSRSAGSYRNRIRILNHLPRPVRVHLRDLWIDRRKFIPAVSPSELRGMTLLEPSVPDENVTGRCLDAYRDIDDNERMRAAAVRAYIQALDSTGNNYFIPSAVYEQAGDHEVQPLLWFPMIMSSRDIAEETAAELMSAGYYSSTWGRPLVFPGVTDRDIYQLDEAESGCPVSVRCSEGILLVPTRRSAEEAAEILSIVRKHLACD